MSKISGYCSCASHGNGRAIFYEWASKGVSLVVVAIDKNELQILKEEIESRFNVNYISLTIDLIDSTPPKEIFSWCSKIIWMLRY